MKLTAGQTFKNGTLPNLLLAPRTRSKRGPPPRAVGGPRRASPGLRGGPRPAPLGPCVCNQDVPARTLPQLRSGSCQPPPSSLPLRARRLWDPAPGSPPGVPSQPAFQLGAVPLHSPLSVTATSAHVWRAPRTPKHPPRTSPPRGSCGQRCSVLALRAQAMDAAPPGGLTAQEPGAS